MFLNVQNYYSRCRLKAREGFIFSEIIYLTLRKKKKKYRFTKNKTSFKLKN